MRINPLIFREYDIRGVVGKDFDKEFAYHLGKAAVTYLDKQEFVVGGDNRLSTESLRESLIKGLRGSGAEVLDLGVVPSCVFYWAILNCKKGGSVDIKSRGGIQITASHNPPQENGFKICDGVFPIYGQRIQELRRIIEKRDYKPISYKEGSYSYYCPIDDYIKDLTNRISLGTRKLKVVIDCGNGTAGLVVEKLFNYYPQIELIKLYFEPDGNFPNHFPDPTIPKFMEDLRKKVQESNADLGVGFDGDVDRIGVIDDKGEIMWGDKLMILFWREILPKHRGCECLIEVKCSQALYEEVERLGGKPRFYKTGHSLIKAELNRVNSPFAGEMSGHMFFKDEYYGFDDAIYAFLRLLRILTNTDKKLSEIAKDIPIYVATPEYRVFCPDNEKAKVVDEVSEYFKPRYKCIDVDGVRVLFEDGWALVRKSNTSPQLILRFEAKTERRLKEIKSIVLNKLREYPQVDISELRDCPKTCI